MKKKDRLENRVRWLQATENNETVKGLLRLERELFDGDA